MSQHRCSSCGAPLPAGKPGDVVRCTFCGAEERIAEASTAPVPAAAAPASAARVGVTGCLVLGSALGALAISAVVAVGLRPRPAPRPPAVVELPVPPRQAPAPAPAPAPVYKGVRPAELSARKAGGGWFLLDAPGMQGKPESFDFLANLDWMLGIARAWSTDARIDVAFLAGMRADGTQDVSTREDWDVDLRFYSPTLREMARKAAEVSEQEVASAFRIEVSQGRTRGYIDTEERLEDETDPPEVRPKCPIAKLMAAWKAHGMPPRPTYQLALQWIQFPSEGGHWRWTVDGEPDFGRQVDLPPLSPETCGALRF